MTRDPMFAEPRRVPTTRALVLVVVGAALAALVVRTTLDGAVAFTTEGGLTRVEQQARAIRRAADETGLDPNLLAGLAFTESSGRIGAVSTADALGLFQLRMPTALERAQLLGLEREPTRDDLLEDPELNARLGASYLRYLVDRFDGNVEAALVAYNTGPTRLAGWIRDAGSYTAWREERAQAGDSQVLAYAEKVLRYRDLFRERALFD